MYFFLCYVDYFWKYQRGLENQILYVFVFFLEKLLSNVFGKLFVDELLLWLKLIFDGGGEGIKGGGV